MVTVTVTLIANIYCPELSFYDTPTYGAYCAYSYSYSLVFIRKIMLYTHSLDTSIEFTASPDAYCYTQGVAATHRRRICDSIFLAYSCIWAVCDYTGVASSAVAFGIGDMFC